MATALETTQSALVEPEPQYTAPEPQIAAYEPPEPQIAPGKPYSPAPATPKREFSFNESWIGRNVFGIAASVLIFFGLLFLKVREWSNVGDWLKVLMMFAVSGALTGLGIVLGRKKQNTFTRILTGCGFGAVFISIFATYLYFHMLSEIVAYCILFVWLAAAMLMTRFSQSVYLCAVAHLGMAISICFSYAQMAGFHQSFLLVYQFVSIAVVIVGNRLCYRQAYRFGLLLSLGLTLVASYYMLYAPYARMDWSVAAPLFAQFLCASSLSYMLSASTARIEGSIVNALAHVLNKLIWVAILYHSIFLPVMYLAQNEPILFGINDIGSPLMFPVLLCAAIVASHLAITLLLRRKQRLCEEQESISVSLLGLVWFGLSLVIWFGQTHINFPVFSSLFVPGLLMLFAGRLSKNRVYGWAASFFFAADLLGALAISYSKMQTGAVVALAASYILFYLFLIMFMRKKLGFSELWERGAVHFASGAWLAMLAILWYGGYILRTPNLSFMFVPGLLLLGVGIAMKNRAYSRAACAFFAADMLGALAIRYGELPWAGVIALAASYILCYLFLIMFMRKKLGFSELWERGAVYFSSAVWLALLAMLWNESYIIKTPHLAFLLLPGLLLMAAYRLSRNGAYKYSANAFFIVDFAFMLAGGYRELSRVASVAAAFGYMLLYLAFIWCQWPLVGGGGRVKKSASMAARSIAYGVAFASIFAILAESGLLHSITILRIALTVVSVALFLLRYEGREKKFMPLHFTMRAMEYLLFATSAYAIAFEEKTAPASVVLFWALAVLTAAIGFMRIRDVLGKPNLAEHIAICLKVTIIILATMRGFAPDWFNAVYVLSLASMVSALVCVIAGFVSKVKPLRLYGLFLTLLCVIKLITYDVRDLETPLRIVALIGGGIICFAISALYSYSEDKLIAKGAERAEGAEGAEGAERADGAEGADNT
jgi:hypothetical protein